MKHTLLPLNRNLHCREVRLCLFKLASSIVPTTLSAHSCSFSQQVWKTARSGIKMAIMLSLSLTHWTLGVCADVCPGTESFSKAQVYRPQPSLLCTSHPGKEGPWGREWRRWGGAGQGHMKGINTNPRGQARYTARKEASRSPSLVVSLTGQFQGPCMFTIARLPPPSSDHPVLHSAQLQSGQAGRRMDIP